MWSWISARPLPTADDFSAVLPHIHNRARKRETFWNSELPISLLPFQSTSEPFISVCPSSWAKSICKSSLFYHCLWKYLLSLPVEIFQPGAEFLHKRDWGGARKKINRCPVFISCTSGITGVHQRSSLGCQCHQR